MRVSYRRGGGGGTENDWCLFSGRQSVDDTTIPNRGIVWGSLALMVSVQKPEDWSR